MLSTSIDAPGWLMNANLIITWSVSCWSRSREPWHPSWRAVVISKMLAFWRGGSSVVANTSRFRFGYGRQDFIPAKMDVKVPFSFQWETLQVMMRFAFINQQGVSIDMLSMFIECESHHYLKCFQLEWVGNLDIHLCRNKILTGRNYI